MGNIKRFDRFALVRPAGNCRETSLFSSKERRILNIKKTVVMLLVLALLTCCLAGCQKKIEPKADASATVAVAAVNALADYLSDIKIQSNVIKTSLEKDSLTQTDMNQKSQALCDLWEGAMTRLLEEAKKKMPEAELAQLNVEQTAWEADMTAAVMTAGKEYEGGTVYTLVVNSEKAKLTEDRVNKLYELLK